MSSAPRGGGRGKPINPDHNNVGYGNTNMINGGQSMRISTQPSFATPQVQNEYPIQNPVLTMPVGTMIQQEPNMYPTAGQQQYHNAPMQYMPSNMDYYQQQTQVPYYPQQQAYSYGQYQQPQNRQVTHQFRHDGPPPAYPPQAMNVPPNPVPAPVIAPRKKCVLLITDPNTGEAVVSDKLEQSKPVTQPTEDKQKAPAPPASSEDDDVKRAQLRKEMAQQIQATMETAGVTVPSPTKSSAFEASENSAHEVGTSESIANSPPSCPAAITELTPPKEPISVCDVIPAKEDTCISPSENDGALSYVHPASGEPEITNCDNIDEEPMENSSEALGADEDDGSAGEDIDEERDDVSSPDSEDDEKKRAEIKAERLREREAELDNLHASLIENSEEVMLEKCFYGRSFLYCVRDIEKEFKRTTCPVTQKNLEIFGIDISSMPKTSDGKKRTNDFAPSWAKGNTVQGSRPNRQFTGRPSHDRGSGGRVGGGGGGGPRKPYNARVSIDRPAAAAKVSLGNKSEHAWKAEKLSAEDLEREDIRMKLLLKQVRSLMNKITPTTKDDLVREFLSYSVSVPPPGSTMAQEQLTQVINIIFDKAVEEPKFCALYSEVCKRQVDAELKENQRLSLFRNALLNRAQQTFMNKTQEEERLVKVKVIADEEDPKKKLQLQGDLAEADAKFRRRKFGNISFIGQLYKQHLLSTKIVNWCLYDLINHTHANKEGELPKPPYDEESLHCAVQMLETLGKQLETAHDFNGKTYLDQTLEHMKLIAPGCSNKIRFMIVGVIELRSNNWNQRKVVDQGPKKISEIHNEIRQEQMETQQQRDSYDRRQGGGMRQGGGSLRRNAPPPRNSLDSRFNGGSVGKNGRMAAAVTSTKLAPSSAAPRNMSLSMVGGSNVIPKKTNWTSGAGGGGSGATSRENAPKPTGSAWGKNGSRDGSEGRKGSRDERASALAAAQKIGGRGIAEQRSSSQLSVVSQDGDETPEAREAAETARQEREMGHIKIMNTINSDLQEVDSGDVKMEDMVGFIFDMIGDEKKYGKPDVTVIFQRFMQASVEKIALRLLPKLGHVLCLSLQRKEHKSAALKGIAMYCTFAVETEAWSDFPSVWTTVAEVLINSILFASPEFEGDRPSFNDFADAFIEASKDIRKDKPYQLLVTALQRMAEINVGLDAEHHATMSSMQFSELVFLRNLDSESLDAALKACRPDVPEFESLFALLNNP